MGLFDNRNKAKNNKIENKKVQIPEPWEYAKRITKMEGVMMKDLPLGWYIYQDGYIWYAIKPDPETGNLIRSFHKGSPEELEEWLGVPVRRTEERRKNELATKVVTTVEETNKPAPPTELENKWAEEKLTEELKQIEAEIKDADEVIAMLSAPATEEEKPKKKRKSLGRTNQIKTRLTDSELTQFNSRVKKSGLAQGEFLRNAALNNQIVIEERSMVDVFALDELARIRADLGRQGGLLKMFIKPNEAQKERNPEEWNEFIALVREMEKMVKRISEVEVKIVNGNSKTQNK